MDNIRATEQIQLDLSVLTESEIYTVQGDTLTLQLAIFNNGTSVDLANYDIAFTARKPDNNFYIQQDNYSIDYNKITIECNKQLTNAIGEVMAELRIYEKTTQKRRSTFTFYIHVVKSALQIKEENSTNSVTLLDALENAWRFIQNFSEYITEANASFTALLDATTQAGAAENSITEALTSIQGDIAAMNGLLNTATTQITSLQNATTAGNTANTSLASSIAEANSKIQALESYADVNALTSRVTTAETDITNLKSTQLTSTQLEKVNLLQKDTAAASAKLFLNKKGQYVSTSNSYSLGKAVANNNAYFDFEGSIYVCNGIAIVKAFFKQKKFTAYDTPVADLSVTPFNLHPKISTWWQIAENSHSSPTFIYLSVDTDGRIMAKSTHNVSNRYYYQTLVFPIE